VIFKQVFKTTGAEWTRVTCNPAIRARSIYSFSAIH
jgi:hypothetical protein